MSSYIYSTPTHPRASSLTANTSLFTPLSLSSSPILSTSPYWPSLSSSEVIHDLSLLAHVRLLSLSKSNSHFSNSSSSSQSHCSHAPSFFSPNGALFTSPPPSQDHSPSVSERLHLWLEQDYLLRKVALPLMEQQSEIMRKMRHDMEIIMEREGMGDLINIRKQKEQEQHFKDTESSLSTPLSNKHASNSFSTPSHKPDDENSLSHLAPNHINASLINEEDETDLK
jgi:hypothetical protein